MTHKTEAACACHQTIPDSFTFEIIEYQAQTAPIFIVHPRPAM
jgi:hypothetical protein